MQIQKKQKKERPTLEQALEPTDGNSKFARALGSVDFHTREKGVQALTKWLSSRSEVSEDDLLKLWKGIFFCFWHSDRAPVQVKSCMPFVLLIFLNGCLSIYNTRKTLCRAESSSFVRCLNFLEDFPLQLLFL